VVVSDVATVRVGVVRVGVVRVSPVWVLSAPPPLPPQPPSANPAIATRTSDGMTVTLTTAQPEARAIASISTLAPEGRAETSIVARAGGRSPTCRA
jgi:hypothetical protein